MDTGQEDSEWLLRGPPTREDMGSRRLGSIAIWLRQERGVGREEGGGEGDGEEDGGGTGRRLPSRWPEGRAPSRPQLPAPGRKRLLSLRVKLAPTQAWTGPH